MYAGVRFSESRQLQSCIPQTNKSLPLRISGRTMRNQTLKRRITEATLKGQWNLSLTQKDPTAYNIRLWGKNKIDTFNTNPAPLLFFTFPFQYFLIFLASNHRILVCHSNKNPFCTLSHAAKLHRSHHRPPSPKTSPKCAVFVLAVTFLEFVTVRTHSQLWIPKNHDSGLNRGFCICCLAEATIMIFNF